MCCCRKGSRALAWNWTQRFIQNIQLITGSLPTAVRLSARPSVVDIQTKNGAFNPGGDVSLYGGSYDTVRPSFEYGGRGRKVQLLRGWQLRPQWHRD